MLSQPLTQTNRYISLDDRDSVFEAFRQAYPAYDSTRKLDELRATEYARLDRQGHVYLDYTGGSLYAESPAARAPGAAQRRNLRQPPLQEPDHRWR